MTLCLIQKKRLKMNKKILKITLKVKTTLYFSFIGHLHLNEFFIKQNLIMWNLRRVPRVFRIIKQINGEGAFVNGDIF